LSVSGCVGGQFLAIVAAATAVQALQPRTLPTPESSYCMRTASSSPYSSTVTSVSMRLMTAASIASSSSSVSSTITIVAESTFFAALCLLTPEFF
jgi:hypothetical protein